MNTSLISSTARRILISGSSCLLLAATARADQAAATIAQNSAAIKTAVTSQPQLAVVPEPATYAMIAGVVVLAYVIWMRRSRTVKA